MKAVNISELSIQDSCNNKVFFSVKESKVTYRNKLPMLGDTVILPISSAMNGFLYGKTRNYKVVEIQNNFVTGKLIILLKIL